MPKCEFCSKSRDQEHMGVAEMQGHWSQLPTRHLICDECAIKKGLKESEKK